MNRPLLLFLLSAVLSVLTFLFKTEHSYDLYLLFPVGLFFIAALLFGFQPQVEKREWLKFAGLATLVWLSLFLISYNLLFFVLVPVSGGIGAWLIGLMSKRILQLPIQSFRNLIIAGVAGASLGVLFMIIAKDFNKEIFDMGLKAGIIVGLWQVAVGIVLSREVKQVSV
jgi:hypothetical protein